MVAVLGERLDPRHQEDQRALRRAVTARLALPFPNLETRSLQVLDDPLRSHHGRVGGRVQRWVFLGSDRSQQGPRLPQRIVNCGDECLTLCPLAHGPNGRAEQMANQLQKAGLCCINRRMPRSLAFLTACVVTLAATASADTISGAAATLGKLPIQHDRRRSCCGPIASLSWP